MDCLISRRLCRKFAATNVSSAPKYVILPRLVSQVHMMAGKKVKEIIIIYLFNVDAKNKVKNYNKKEIIVYIINYNI